MPGFTGLSGVGPPCVDFPSPNSVSCPQSGSCKFMNITTSMHHSLFGNVTVTQMERGCGEEGMSPNMCLTASDLDGVLDEIRGSLSSLEAIGLTFQEIDGQVCTCNTGDLCNERPLDVATTTVTPATSSVTGEIEVRNLQAVPLSASSVSVSWEPPAESADLVTAYAILIWDVTTGQLISHSVELPGEHSLLVNDLMGDTEYVIDVTPLGREIVSRTASTPVVLPAGSTMGPTTQSSHSQVNLESDGAVAAITSPNFPLDYPDNTNVSWRVTVPSGCQLHVHFVTFDTAFRDWLHIGDGHSYFGPVKPFDFDVNSEHTLIRFVSNDRSTSTGFNITVQADCMQGAGTTEQPLLLDTDGGNVSLVPGLTYRIASPNFPGDYDDSSDVLWSINSPAGCSLNVEFLNFTTENTFDYVKVGPGSTQADATAEETRITGDRETPFDAMVNSPSAFVYFHSDGSVRYSGFRADLTLQCQEGSTIGPMVQTTQSSHSQVNLESDGAVAVITSPNFPMDYPDNTDVSWNVTVPSGCQLHVHFVTFYTGIGDWLYIGDDHSYFGPLRPDDIDVNSEHTLIRFVSDDSIARMGFNLTLRADCMQGAITTEQPLVPDADGGNVSLVPGMTYRISTPNFPNNYPVYSNVLWFFNAPDGCSVNVRFLSFRTENTFDFVKVGPGSTGADVAAVERKISGDPETPYDVMVNSPRAFVYFSSDGSVTHTGFHADLTLQCQEGSTMVPTTQSSDSEDAGNTEQPLVPDTNGGNINLVPELTYRIASPNFPNSYPYSDRVLWSISAPDGCSLNVRFLNFTTESFYDYVKAGPGLTEADVAAEVRKFSGDRETPFDIMVNSNEAFVYFYSDGSLSYSGFRADLTLQCQEGSTMVPTTQGSHSLVNLESDGAVAVITSPNFPRTIPTILMCRGMSRCHQGVSYTSTL
ncbi:tolloid-like protein 2 [Diadema antillarum]|uniref:tolloid-like protein 2 n=1 Tax=Diadema antillarum TaxID=105358 RepID=UPI003A842106